MIESRKNQTIPTTVLKVYADKKYVDASAWKALTDNVGATFHRWLTAANPNLKFKIGDTFEWTVESGTGGGKPTIYGMVRVHEETVDEVIKQSGNRMAIVENGIRPRFFFDKFQWQVLPKKLWEKRIIRGR